jgi:DNA-binding transcriptional MerR regulator
VAQLGSALRSGRRGRGFESRHPDTMKGPGQRLVHRAADPGLLSFLIYCLTNCLTKSFAHGIPLVATLTGRNRHDVTQLLPLLDAVPSIRGIRGRPRSKPRELFADRGCDFEKYRRLLRERGICPRIARRRRRAWLWTRQNPPGRRTRFRRAPRIQASRTRYERRADRHLGLPTRLRSDLPPPAACGDWVTASGRQSAVRRLARVERQISEAASAAGLSVDTLRYYEELGLLDPPRRDSAGRRWFSDDDVAWLVFLRRMRETGMPLSQLSDYVGYRRAGVDGLAGVLAVLTEHRAAMLARRAELDECLRIVDGKLAKYRVLERQGRPAGPPEV